MSDQPLDKGERPAECRPGCENCPCHCRHAPVRVDSTMRWFTCPSCEFVRPHPPVDAFLYLIDRHAYCDWCGTWMRIENYRTFKTPEEFERAQQEAIQRLKDEKAKSPPPPQPPQPTAKPPTKRPPPTKRRPSTKRRSSR